jgi:hypothetical protein
MTRRYVIAQANSANPGAPDLAKHHRFMRLPQDAIDAAALLPDASVFAWAQEADGSWKRLQFPTCIERLRNLAEAVHSEKHRAETNAELAQSCKEIVREVSRIDFIREDAKRYPVGAAAEAASSAEYNLVAQYAKRKARL